MFISNQNSAGAADWLSQRPALAAASELPRIVTTGRKINQHRSFRVEGIDQDSGDQICSYQMGSQRVYKQFLNSVDGAPASSAFIDAVAFSVRPPDEQSYLWVLEQLKQFIPIESIEHRRGLHGFKFSLRINGNHGAIAWGGDNQNGIVYVSLMGQACAMVRDWFAFQSWLETHRAVIKRADAAHDDHEGKFISIDWAIAQYDADGFNAGGRKPKHRCIGDWLDGNKAAEGLTLYIGRRGSGKMARIYQKGKQLGDASSSWTRIEVEWTSQDRVIHYDILTNPGKYLAGAYPCTGFLNQEQDVIKTIRKSAQIVFDHAVENAKQHVGKLVNVMLKVFSGDYAEVVTRLIRDGVPARIEPYSYHIRDNPSMLDPQMREAFA